MLAERAKARSHEPMRVFEIGAGAGGLALDVLDFLRHQAPHVYRSVRYTAVEASSALAGKQMERVVRSGGHEGKFESVLRGECHSHRWRPSKVSVRDAGHLPLRINVRDSGSLSPQVSDGD